MTSELGARAQCDSIGPPHELNRSQHRPSRAQPPLRFETGPQTERKDEPEGFRRPKSNRNGQRSKQSRKLGAEKDEQK